VKRSRPSRPAAAQAVVPTAREEARRNTRARFEQWAKNPTCQANTVSAVHNIRMTDVAKHAALPTTFGQSPFAIARGDNFERGLFYNKAERLRAALIEAEVLPKDAFRFLDLRLRMNGGTRINALDDAIAQTTQFLHELVENAGDAPAIVAGATVRIPKGVMLPEANLIIDALAIRADGPKPQLIVGEIKTYPDRGGYTDPAELAMARAQAGIYLHALQLVAERESIASAIELSTVGFLVLSRPGSNRPSIRAQEDLRFQAVRAKRGFELLEKAAHEIPSIDQGATNEQLLTTVMHSSRSYGESCLSFCDLAPRCFGEALDAGDPIILGEDVQRFLGPISLPRAMELLDGAQPRSEAEADVVRRMVEGNGAAAS
jgi:hypothetical protein